MKSEADERMPNPTEMGIYTDPASAMKSEADGGMSNPTEMGMYTDNVSAMKSEANERMSNPTETGIYTDPASAMQSEPDEGMPNPIEWASYGNISVSQEANFHEEVSFRQEAHNAGSLSASLRKETDTFLSPEVPDASMLRSEREKTEAQEVSIGHKQQIPSVSYITDAGDAIFSESQQMAEGKAVQTRKATSGQTPIMGIQEEIFFEEEAKDILLEDTKEINIQRLKEELGDTKEMYPRRRIIYPSMVQPVKKESPVAPQKVEEQPKAEEQQKIVQQASGPVLMSVPKPSGFEQMLSQDYDGQISLVVPSKGTVEKQITGQMNIAEIMNEWERLKEQNEEKRRQEIHKQIQQHTDDMFSEFDESIREDALGQISLTDEGLPVAINNESLPSSEESADKKLLDDSQEVGMPVETMADEAVEEILDGSMDVTPVKAKIVIENESIQEEIEKETTNELLSEVEKETITEVIKDFLSEIDKEAVTEADEFVTENESVTENNFTTENELVTENNSVTENELVAENNSATENELVAENNSATENELVAENGSATENESVAENEPANRMMDELQAALENESAKEIIDELQTTMGTESADGIIDGIQAVIKNTVETEAVDAIVEEGSSEIEEFTEQPFEILKENSISAEGLSDSRKQRPIMIRKPDNSQKAGNIRELRTIDSTPEGAKVEDFGQLLSRYEQKNTENSRPAVKKPEENLSIQRDKLVQSERAAELDRKAMEQIFGQLDEFQNAEPVLPEMTASQAMRKEVVAEKDSFHEVRKEPLTQDIAQAIRRDLERFSLEQQQMAEEMETASDTRKLTEEEKQLFSGFIHNRNMKAQILAALDEIGLEAGSGNVILTGEEGSGTIELAKKLSRVLQAADSNFSGKIAKISADTLNEKDVTTIFDQLEDSTLIIEHASNLSYPTIVDMKKVLAEEDRGLFLILEDQINEMDSFLEEYPELMEYFDARIDVDSLDDRSLEEYARQYAEKNECSIDEMAVLALHSKIGELQTGEHEVTVAEVKDMMDDAIYFAKKRNLTHFFDILLGKRYDEEDMIIIRERDFMH